MNSSLKLGRGVALASAALIASLMLSAFSGAASGSETPPVNTVLPVASPAQPYAGWSVEGTKGTWTGEPTSYSYAWFACNYSCEEVSTNHLSYTPQQADVGKTLYLAVTATNSAGSTTANSNSIGPVAKSLNWFSCAKKASGTYEDSGCTKVGSENTYSWERRSSQINTENSGRLIIKWVNGGTVFEVGCSQAPGTGFGANSASKAQLTGYTLSLSGCTVERPSGNGCLIGNGGKITSNSLKGVTPVSPAALNPELKMEPTTGATVATFTWEGCEAWWLNGTYNLTGWFPAQVHNESSAVSTGYSESTAGLKINSFKAGIDIWSSMTTEVGENVRKVKLDTAP